MKNILQLSAIMAALFLTNLATAKPLVIINEGDSNGHVINISYKVCHDNDEGIPSCTGIKKDSIADHGHLEINLADNEALFLMETELYDQDGTVIAKGNYSYIDPELPEFTDSHCTGYAQRALLLGNHGLDRVICVAGA